MTFVERLADLLERPLIVGDDQPTPVDAIVVLGAPLHRGRLSRIGHERVAGALALWHLGGAPLVCTTGRGEAEAMAAALHAGGVPQAAIVVEPTARTTFENAQATAALLAPRGVREVWLVTQPFHARRAMRLFTRAGLTPRAWHLTDSLQYRNRGQAVRWLLREYAAWVRGALPGR